LSSAVVLFIPRGCHESNLLLPTHSMNCGTNLVLLREGKSMQRLNFVLLFLSFPALATTWIVHPGESIQDAVDQASPGDTISILPGTYREAGRTCPSDYTQRCAVVISKDDLQIIGASSPGHPVVLENAGGQDQGIAVGVVNAPGRTCLQVPSQRIQ